MHRLFFQGLVVVRLSQLVANPYCNQASSIAELRERNLGASRIETYFSSARILVQGGLGNYHELLLASLYKLNKTPGQPP